jgi:hypothetical protein
LLAPLNTMMARNSRTVDQPFPPDPPTAPAGVRLTDEERLAIQAAAEADGYSESFTDLLCHFAELIGTAEVLGELKRMEPKDTEKP